MGLAQMIFLLGMRNLIEEIEKPRVNEEATLSRTAQLQQALAQIEATLLRKENQKVTEKTQKTNFSCVKKFQTYNFYLRILETTYK